MARLIDADEVLKDNTWEWFDDWGNYTLAGQAIADAPTVDAVEVVHGEWRLDLYTAKHGNPYRCSECREEYGDTYNYCPNCGAKMDGGEKE